LYRIGPSGRRRRHSRFLAELKRGAPVHLLEHQLPGRVRRLSTDETGEAAREGALDGGGIAGLGPAEPWMKAMAMG